MKNFQILITLITSVISVGRCGIEFNQNLTEYLDEQAHLVYEQLKKESNGEVKNLFAIDIRKNQTYEFDAQHSYSFFCEFFGEKYVLLDNKFYKLTEKNYHMEYIFNFNEKVKFSKAVEHENLGLLLIVTKPGNLHIFGFERNTHTYFSIQKISNPFNISDAIFLSHENSLYFVISSQIHNLVSTDFYKFEKTYFNKIETVLLTTSETKLFYLDNGKNALIIIVQTPIKRKPISTVYKLENAKLKKIGVLNIKNPVEVLNYKNKNSSYLLSFENNNDVSVHQWTGKEFINVNKYTIKSAPNNRQIFYANGIPFLISTLENKLFINSLADCDNYLNLIYNSSIEISLVDSLKFLKQENQLFFTAIGDSNENKTVLVISSIFVKTINYNDNCKKTNPVENQLLSTCFLKLENSIYRIRNTIKTKKNQTKNAKDATDNQQRFTETKSNLNEIMSKYGSLEPHFRANLKNSDVLVIKKSIIIKHPLQADKVASNNTNFKIINNQQWLPTNWLQYSKSQKIASPYKVKIITVKKLQPDSNDNMFQNLLLTTGNQIKSSGNVIVKNLNANGVTSQKINDVPTENIYYKSNPVMIKGIKQFSRLSIKSVKVESINKMKGSDVTVMLTHPKMSKYEFNKTLTVKNLWIDNINDIEYNAFKNSIFLLGNDDKINGNLLFNTLHANKANFDILDQYKSVLTLSTDQVIVAPIFINKIFTQNIETNLINGIKFNDVSTFKNNTIAGPVRINEFHISGNLEDQGNITDKLVKNKNHVEGTNESDFLQIYNSKVLIKGDLIVKNVNIKDTASVQINNEDYDPKMNNFWTKSTNQEVPIHFEAMNGIITPNLRTTFLNAISVMDYMVDSENTKHLFTKFYFEDVEINGDVILNQEKEHSPDLKKIEENAINLNDNYDVKGKKTYKGTLRVDKLEADLVEIFGQNHEPLTGSKTFKNLFIKKKIIAEKITTNKISNFDLDELQENAVFINKESELDETFFRNVTVKHLILNSLKKQELNDVIELKDFNTIQNLKINGNLTIHDIPNLISLNKQNVSKLIEISTTKFNGNKVSGNIKFVKNVKVKNFFVQIINEEDFSTLTNRLLYRHWDQNITKPYIFTNLKTENLITSKINNINVLNLINVAERKTQNLTVPNGLKFLNNVQLKSLSGNFNCNLYNALHKIQNPELQSVQNLKIIGNVTFWDQEFELQTIFNNAVTRNGNNIITKTVKFTQNITTNNAEITKIINDVDINEVIQDALLINHEKEQIITAEKTFTALTHVERVNCLGDVKVNTINFMNTTEIGEKIIPINTIDISLRGKKKFVNGLQCKHLHIDQIDDVDPRNIASTNDAKMIPQALIEEFIVENFNINLINLMPLDELLQNRLLKRADKQIINATYFFRDIDINGNMSTAHINDINIENLVFDTKKQVIESIKTFSDDLNFIGNINTKYINGVELSETYEQAVLRNEKTTFKKQMSISSPSTVRGNINTNFINNIPVDYIMKSSVKSPYQNDAKQIDQITKTLNDFTSNNFKFSLGMPSEFKYLEQSAKIQISLPKTIKADIIENKDYALIHIGTEEDGYSCGLPKNCPCPMQYTIQISDKHSVSLFPNKGAQRVFSYHEDDVHINFISNSVSRNAECRTVKSTVMNEISSLTWNVVPNVNTSGGFYMHEEFFPGYISDVKFFTLEGTTYVLVATYYDSVLDSHKMGCDIYKFNYDNTKLEKIQHIPGQGLWTMSVMYTYKGVTLIIGKSIMEFDYEKIVTEIYRFRKETYQFELLRTVPSFGSLSAVGVVLGADSLIVLANRQSTLHILKYYNDYDNYYFYQSFQLDDPIYAMSVFYSGDFGTSDAYLNVVTKTNKFFIYSFQFIQGWKLESSGQVEGLKGFIPFKLNQATYLFAPSSNLSSLLTFVKHDSD